MADQQGDGRNNGDPLDFTSSSFDAARALNDPSAATRLPCPKAKMFNNLDEYFKKTFKKTVAQNASSKNGKEDPDSFSTPERRFTEEQIASSSIRSSNRRSRGDPGNVLTKMNQSGYGPLSLLHKCLNKRIRILIRRRKLGPLSTHYAWLSALLVAFDKHMNLIVNDVDEMVKIIDEHHNLSTVRERHNKKLFVRGDNIIIISLI